MTDPHLTLTEAEAEYALRCPRCEAVSDDEELCFECVVDDVAFQGEQAR